MKKICTFLMLMATIVGFSQTVTVNTSSYTVDQLINAVLIDFPCTSGLNVVQKNGNQFGSTNSIGYFENFNASTPNVLRNPNFPFLKGVVLTTGDATKVPAPNNSILSDGNAAWTGDADLEANLLSQSGITFNSVNASYLEFDFVPKTATFNFGFLFASEEYGTSQCDYSDAFAFLLKDLDVPGSSYVNIAVVPSTNAPITVATIRDNTYNPGCSSENVNWFGAFNGNGFGPAINFNGQTKEMTAIATLQLTHHYHMKIVIADGKNNTGYDSAIFLKANSLNIGQTPLPLDQVGVNGFCPGSTLPTPSAVGLAPGTTYTWTINSTNFIVNSTTVTSIDLNNPAYAIYLLPGGGVNTLKLNYKEPGCLASSDEYKFEIFPKINSLAVVPNIYVCNTGASSYSFDLTKNTTVIMTNNTPQIMADDLPATTVIKYYLTNAQAVAGVASTELPNIYTGVDNQFIYARIINSITGCYEIRSFQLKLIPPPVLVGVPAAVTQCARISTTDLVPQSVFNFTAQMATILGGSTPAYYSVSFHFTQVGADTNTAIMTRNLLATSQSRTVYVRIQNISDNSTPTLPGDPPSCYATTSFQINVTPLPPIDVVSDVTTCTSYSLPVLVNVPTATTAGAGYYTATHLPNGSGGTLIPANTVYNTVGSTTTLFVYNQTTTGTPICKNEKSFKIKIVDLAAITPASATYCQNDNHTLTPLTDGNYYDNQFGTGSPITGPITTSQNLYVVFSDPNAIPTACTIYQPFTITILPFTNLVQADYPNLFSCNPNFNLPLNPLYFKDAAHTIPFTAADNPINTTTIIYVYEQSNSVPNCESLIQFTVTIGLGGSGGLQAPSDVTECTSYILPNLSVGEYRTAASSAAGPGGVNVPALTPINTTTTLYYYVPGQACTYNLPFTVTILTTPLPTITDVTACDEFTIPTIAHLGDFYTGPGKSGIKLTAGTKIYTSQTLYFYYNSGSSSSSGIPCILEAPMVVTINATPPLDAYPIEVIKCNQSYTPIALTNGHYYNLPGGPTNTSPNPTIDGIPITAGGTHTIYAYNNSTNPLNTCFAEYSISVVIVDAQVTPIADIYACDSYTLPAILGIGDYYHLSGGIDTPSNPVIPTSFPPITTVGATTFWVYAANNTRVHCFSEDSFTVNIITSPTIAAVAPITKCDTYTLPAYNDPMFVTTGAPVTHYYTMPGGPTVVGNQEMFPNDIIISTITLYPYNEVGTSTTKICWDDTPWLITINHTPVIQPIAPIGACDNYVLPAFNDPMFFTNVPISHFYTTATEPFIDYTPSTISAPGATVYAYAETGTTPNCWKTEQFVITVHNTPTIAAVAPMTKCDNYTLPAFTDPMFVTTGANVSHYYETTNLGLPEHNVSEVISNTITLYPYVSVGSNTAGDKECHIDTPWVITINHTPIIQPITAIGACDNYTLPAFNDPMFVTTGAPITHFYTTATEPFIDYTPSTISAPGATVYAYAETGTTSNCWKTEQFVITVHNTPTIAAVTPIASCDQYTLPLFSNPMFVTTGAPVTHYYTIAGGPTVPGNLEKLESVSINGSITLYPYVAVGSTAIGDKVCYDDTPWAITINQSPVISPVAPVFACDTYTLPAYTDSMFITTGTLVTHFYTMPGGPTVVGNQEKFPTDLINVTTTLYPYVSVGTNAVGDTVCFDDTPWVITITYTPVIAPVDYANVNVCNSYTLPTLTTVGANYYTGANGAGTIITANTVFTTNQLIHVYAENGVAPNTCPSIDQTLSIVIYNVDDPYPLSIYPNGVPSCGPYLLPALTTLGAQYFNGPNGSGGNIPANTGGQIYVYNTQPVYIFGTSPSGCTDEVVFNVTVNVNPIANLVPVALTTACDLDGIDDHITSFDVTTLTSTVLGTQSPAIYTVAYYPTPLDAAANTNAIVTTTTLGTIYVKVSNTATPSCNVIMPITISVVPLPKIDLGLKGTICIDSTTGQINPPVISSGYSSALYSFLWTDSSTPPIGVGTFPDFIPTIPGNYTLVITASGVSGCASLPIPVTVIQSAKPVSVSFTTSGWFTNNQTVIVDAVPYPGTGNGSNFVYSLDGQTPQTSNIFTNVDSTSHEVTVIDINGCGDLPLPIPVPLVNSPAYFSPNGDGINDLWRIQGLQNQLSSQIYIYDRYGKMIKQLSGNSDGWDGTFNGLALPADDYWFTVTYIENGDPKEFKSHFTLRR